MADTETPTPTLPKDPLNRKESRGHLHKRGQHKRRQRSRRRIERDLCERVLSSVYEPDEIIRKDSDSSEDAVVRENTARVSKGRQRICNEELQSEGVREEDLGTPRRRRRMNYDETIRQRVVREDLCMPGRRRKEQKEEEDRPFEERVRWDRSPLDGVLDPVRWLECSTRGQRKRWQIESFVPSLRMLVDAFLRHSRRRKLKIVDFGCGSGNLGLCVAALFPKQCDVILIDMNVVSIELCRRRAKEAGLSNVHIECARIEEYSESFDICVSLHACGNASDFAQALAMKWNAAYIMAPCCVGKLRLSDKFVESCYREKVNHRSSSRSSHNKRIKYNDVDDALSFYENLSRVQLTYLLTYNGTPQRAQKKKELARRCAEMEKEGVPCKCPKCKKGRMKRCSKNDGSWWSCLHYTYDINTRCRVFCSYRTNQDVPRRPWILPPGLRNRRRRRVGSFVRNEPNASSRQTGRKDDDDTDTTSLAHIVCSNLRHPRSDWMRRIVTEDEFLILASGADHMAGENDCKFLVECDRNAAAREMCRYTTRIGLLFPSACTNKRHILIGVPPHIIDDNDASSCLDTLLKKCSTLEYVDDDNACLKFVTQHAVRGSPPETGRCSYFIDEEWRYCRRRLVVNCSSSTKKAAQNESGGVAITCPQHGV